MRRGALDTSRRIRRLRFALAALLVGVLIAVAWGLRRPAEKPVAFVAPEARPTVGERGEQCRWMQVVGDRQNVGFEAPECFTEADGTQRLTGDERRGPVRVTIQYHVHGESDVMTIEAMRCEYRPQGQRAQFEGGVRITTGLGLEAQMASVTYDGDSGIAESSEAVEFKRKQLSGRGRALRLDVRQGQMTLGGRVELRIVGEDGSLTKVFSDAATFDRRSGEFDLSGNVSGTSGETQLTSQRLRGRLALPGYALERLIAVGGVRIRSAGGALIGQAGLKVSTGTYVLRCERVELPLRENGTPEALQAGPQGVHFELWPRVQGGRERRSLDAKAATFRFDEQGRLSSIHGHGDVLLKRQTGVPGAVDDEMRCGALQVGLDPASGEIVTGEFITSVVVTRGRQKALAGRALYAKSELTLLEEPEVVDPDAGLRVLAERIGLGVGPKQGEVNATGHVRKTLKRSGGGARGLLEAPEMVVQCEAMRYNIPRGTGIYRIGALLRAGSDEVRAHQIQVRDVGGKRRMMARYRVQAVLRVGEGDGTAPGLVHARAREMLYEEAAGVLKFTGSVEVRHSDLIITTPETVKIQLAGSTMESLLAGATQVEVAMGARQGSGAQARYLPAEGKLVMEGPRVVYRDAEGGTLRGRTLTLIRAEDRILVDGKDVERTGMTIRRGGLRP